MVDFSKHLTKNQIQPSIFQMAIFNWIANPSPKHLALVIEAVAGSGKTTTIVMGTEYVPASDRLLYVAFNKRNIEDLRPKLPSNAEAATLNSVGHRAWLRFLGISKIEVNGSKTFNLIDRILPDYKLSESIKKSLIDQFKVAVKDEDRVKRYEQSLNADMSASLNDLHRLVALAKGCGLVPQYSLSQANGRITGLVEDTTAAWMGMIEQHDLDLDRPDVAIEVARRVLSLSIKIANEEIDYDDQLYMPIIAGARFQQFPWVFVDEAQDLNFIQYAIIRRSLIEGGRAVFVGDRFQSIYGFRGSMTNSLDLIKAEFDAEELPLSICYRCGKSIVAEAQRFASHIQPHPEKGDGQVINLPLYGPKSFTKNDAVICRNTRPLVDLAYKLIRTGMPARILGKDIEHGLVKLAKKMKTKDVDVLTSRLDDYQKREVEKMRKKKQEDRAQSLMDRVETLRIFINELPETQRSLDKLIESINKLFKMDQVEKRQMLVLSTIHKAKGGEWENVFILDPHLMPSKWASQDWQLQQEVNLQYVAVTRAKNKLAYITSEGFEGDAKKAA